LINPPRLTAWYNWKKEKGKEITMLIETKKGMIDSALLDVRDIVTTEDNARVISTEWSLNGDLVRRDVSVNILRGLELCNSINEDINNG